MIKSPQLGSKICAMMHKISTTKQNTTTPYAINVIPGFTDNYFYVLHHKVTGNCIAVDPGDAAPVLQFIKSNKLQLTSIWITHHHRDHIGGVTRMAEEFPNITVYCSAHDFAEKRIPFATLALNDGDQFIAFAELPVSIKYLPGHTKGHIAYEVKIADQSEVFVGDVIFGGGCGGIFEGDMETLFATFVKIKKTFKPNSRIWCAHEYTEKNLTVSLNIDATNLKLQNRLKKVQEMRSKGQQTVPLLFQDELDTNPFLRFNEKELQRFFKSGSDFETFREIRKFRDQF